MEAFKIFEQMNRAAGDIGQDPQMQRRMKEFWNMLEELSTNSPEVRLRQEYQKLIEKQLKSGLEDIKKEQDAARTDIRVELGGCMRIATRQGTSVFVNLCHSDK